MPPSRRSKISKVLSRSLSRSNRSFFSSTRSLVNSFAGSWAARPSNRRRECWLGSWFVEMSWKFKKIVHLRPLKVHRNNEYCRWFVRRCSFRSLDLKSQISKIDVVSRRRFWKDANYYESEELRRKTVDRHFTTNDELLALAVFHSGCRCSPLTWRILLFFDVFVQRSMQGFSFYVQTQRRDVVLQWHKVWKKSKELSFFEDARYNFTTMNMK